MNSIQAHALGITRRHFFKDCGVGVGKIALASLLVREASAKPPATSRLTVDSVFAPSVE